MTEYAVIYERADDGGWDAYSPDLPGCVALGATRGEAEHNMREAITLHFAELRRRGEPIPEARNFAGVVSVPGA
jgi:predicted RNase H-like HicB family nuclease